MGGFAMRIGVLTSSRADFGIYLPLLKRIRSDQDIDLQIIAFGTHCSNAHGRTVQAIYKSGFKKVDTISSLLTDDSEEAIATAYGLTVIKFADYWSNNEFDLVLLIYTDLGVLIPNERDTVLINIHNALRQNGLFIFDVINAENVEKKFEEKRNWNYESSGFWSDIPHLELSEGFHYPENKVFLQQHIIIDQKENLKLYRFWTHYFEDRDISRILSDRGFINVKTYRDVLPSTNIWNGENISFYKSSKF